MKNTDGFYRIVLENIYDGVYIVDPERRILFWNKGAERITGLTAEELVGTLCMESPLHHLDSQGRLLCDEGCLVAETLTDGLPRQAELYVRHKDGYNVPVAVRVSPVRAPDGSIAGAVEVFSDNSSKEATIERIRELEQLAALDPLTGLGNRRYAEMSIRARIDEVRRYGWRSGLLFIDIDHFKRVNDTYGHDVGDEVLKMVARTLANSVRPFDVVARWGGEEFVALILNMPKGALRSIANRCRALVEASSLPVGQDLVRVTISVGGALARADDIVARLVKRADRLMYESKRAGGNSITVDPEA